MVFKTFIAICACAALAYCANWPTFGGDPERSGWARDESVLTRESVAHMKLLWSKKLDNQARELTALTAPVVIGNLFTTRGDPGAAWTECLAAAAERFPGTGIVGYQAGEELAAAHDVGFLSVGPLRVWMAESD